MESEAAEDKNNGRDKTDALVGQAELEVRHEEIPSQEEQSDSRAALETVVTSARLPDSEVRALSGALYRKAIFERESSVCVIWNASGILSLSPGLHMTIGGMDYTAQDVIHGKHLVMRCSTKET